jgi:hypothetical protein
MYRYVVVAALAATPAHAEGLFGPDPDDTPSVFSYGFRGFGAGALVGAGTGYLIVRAREDGAEELRTFALSVAGGAVAGGVAGLALGLVDLADDRPGAANLALRDVYYGSLFGVATGALVGGMVALETEDPEHVLFGAAIGTVSGAVVGLAIGLVEGARIVDSPAHRRRAGRSWGLALAPIADGTTLSWGPSLSGSF